MKRILKRSLLDQLGAFVLLGISSGVFAVAYRSSFVVYLVPGTLLVMACINTVYTLLTPIGKISGSVLSLYSETQPIVFDIFPKKIYLDQVSELIIDKRPHLPKAIFCFPHGESLYHSFPSKNDQRINTFLEFLGKDVQHRIIE